MTPIIRLATIDDAPQIQAIYAPIVNDTFISFEQVIPTIDEIAARIEKTLKQYPWLVCQIGDKVAGYAYGSAFRTRLAYQWTTEVTAYTHPDFHRLGVGRGVYTSLFNILRQQNYYNAVAGIALPNDASVGFHEAMGFKKIGVFNNVGYKLDGWRGVGWWEMELQLMPDAPQNPTPITDLANHTEFTSWLSSGQSLVKNP